MSFSQYRTFIVTAETQNMTKAADLLGYTQPAVSRLISALEAELGATLLLRTRRGVCLTAEGQALLPSIKQVVSAIEAMRQKAGEMKDAKSGTLRVGTFSSIALSWLPDVLNKFRQAQPDTEVLVFNGTYSYVEQALLEDAVDCAFVTMPSRDEFIVEPLLCDRLLVVMNAENKLAKRGRLQAEDLEDQEFIVPAEGSGYDIYKLFARVGISPKTRLTINDDYAAVEMVRKGHGVTILPELLVNSLSLSDDLVTAPLTDSQRKIGFAVRKKGRRSQIVKRFQAFLSQNKDIQDPEHRFAGHSQYAPRICTETPALQ